MGEPFPRHSQQPSQKSQPAPGRGFLSVPGVKLSHNVPQLSCNFLPRLVRIKQKHIVCREKIQCDSCAFLLAKVCVTKAAASTEPMINSLVTARLAVAPYFLLFNLLPLQAVQHVAVASHPKIAQSHRTSISTFGEI